MDTPNATVNLGKTSSGIVVAHAISAVAPLHCGTKNVGAANLTQLTIDHTWAQEAIERGHLTPIQARTHPNRNVLKRYLGINPETDVDLRIRQPGSSSDELGKVSSSPLTLEPGDVLVLCTDGLTDLVPDHDLKATVTRYPPQHAANRLVSMARAKGGADNITVLILSVEKQREFALGRLARTFEGLFKK